nr:ATP-binding cassette domain-containing protein [Halonotius terrestris]
MKARSRISFGPTNSDRLEERQEHGGDRSVSSVEEITFDNVTFSYTDDERVLDGVSVDVTRGEFVTLVDQSGAGKSTIVSLLARLYQPDNDEISADGVSISEFDLQQWHERIAVVRQQPFIFDDTLERNVTVGNRDATREEVETVCRIAMVEEFIDGLPNGYESQLGDDGVRLSGGQRQRVAVARALLTDVDFLVLDEATSDLDSGLEADLQASIESMDREVGIVAIAHRFSTVRTPTGFIPLTAVRSSNQAPTRPCWQRQGPTPNYTRCNQVHNHRQCTRTEVVIDRKPEKRVWTTSASSSPAVRGLLARTLPTVWLATTT